MEYISVPRKKIPALAGFEPPPVEAKISKAHVLPSELAGPGYFKPWLPWRLNPIKHRNPSGIQII